MQHPHDLFSWRPSDSDLWAASPLKVHLFLPSMKGARARIAMEVELPDSVLFMWLDAIHQGTRWEVA